MDISYFHGREVVSVLTGEEAHGYDGAVWAIKLAAEGYIFCFDESHDPPVLDGLAFTTSEVTDTDAKLYFGTDNNPTGTVVVLRTDKIGYMDDLYSEGAVERPGQAQETAQEATGSPVPAENIGGTPDGPSEVFLAAQEQRDIEDDESLGNPNASQEPVPDEGDTAH